MRYVLEGSVQRSGKQVRVNAQLIDAESDAHLWAERFERDIGDLFALQNEITSRIAHRAQFRADPRGGRPTDRAIPTRWTTFSGDAPHAPKPPSRDNYAEAIGLFERALALDPRSVEAQSSLASALAGRVLDNMTDTAAADLARAEGLAGQALAASPGSPLAHLAKGQVLRAQRRYAEAIPEYEAALALDRNLVIAYARSRPIQVLHRVDRGGNPARGASHPPQPPRSRARQLVSCGSGSCICCNRAPTRRSSGSKRRAAPIRRSRIRASSPPPMPSKARPNAPPPNSPKPAGLAATIDIRASPVCGRRRFRGAEGPRLGRSHFFRRPAQGRDAGGMIARCGPRHSRSEALGPRSGRRHGDGRRHGIANDGVPRMMGPFKRAGNRVNLVVQKTKLIGGTDGRREPQF